MIIKKIYTFSVIKFCTDYIDGATLTIHFLGVILEMKATLYWPGYIFIVGKHCTDYIVLLLLFLVSSQFSNH